MLGAELAAADDAAADGAAADGAVADGADADDAAADDAGADDAGADGDAELPAALRFKATADGLFDADADAAAPMTMSAPNAMSPVSTLCRAGQDLRFCPFGGCGGCGRWP